MNQKSNTLYVTTEQEQLDALRITLGMRMKLSEWDQVHHALNRSEVSGIALPMRQMLAKLLLEMHSKSRALPHPTNLKDAHPYATAELDTDDLNELRVLVHFNFTLEQWKKLVEQLCAFHRSDPADRMYQAIRSAMDKLSGKFTVELVGGETPKTVAE